MPDDVTCQVSSAEGSFSIDSLSVTEIMLHDVVPLGLATAGFASGAESGSETSDIPEYDENMQKLCRRCSRKLYPVQLQLCQINFEEAIFLCVREDCQFPLLEPDVGDFIVKRNIAQLAQVLRKRGQLNPQPNESSEAPAQAPFVSPQSALHMLNLFPDDILYESLFSTDESSQEETLPVAQPDKASASLATGDSFSDKSFGSLSDNNMLLDSDANNEMHSMIFEQTVESDMLTDTLLNLPNNVDPMEGDRTVDSIVSKKNLGIAALNQTAGHFETALTPNKKEKANEVVVINNTVTPKSKLSSMEPCSSGHTMFNTDTAVWEAAKTVEPTENDKLPKKIVTKTKNEDLTRASEPAYPKTDTLVHLVANTDGRTGDGKTIDTTSITSVPDVPMEILSSPTSPTSEANANIHEDQENDPIMFLKEVSAEPVGPPPRNQELLQWKNNKNSCWLDVLLHCFVSTPTVRLALNSLLTNEKDDHMLLRLCRLYDSCQDGLLNGSSFIELQKRMEKTRDNILSFLVSRFQLHPGAHEGAAEMFRNIMKINKSLAATFSVTLRWEMECEACEHKEIRRVKTELVSFLSPTQSFHPLNATSMRSCSSCAAENQPMTMVMEKVPACLMMHFQHGLTHNRFSTMDFGLHGHLFAVCAVVQYITDTFHHFIVWIRDCKANKWVRCDDLQKPKCQWQKKPPKIPPKQIHMIMWEKQGILPSYFTTDPPPEGALQHLLPVENLEAALSDDEIVPDTGDVETIDLEDMEEKSPGSDNTIIPESSSQVQNQATDDVKRLGTPAKSASNIPVSSESSAVAVQSLSPVDDGISNIILSDSDTSDDFALTCKKHRKVSNLALSPTSSDASSTLQNSPKLCEGVLLNNESISIETAEKPEKTNCTDSCNLGEEELSPRSYTAAVIKKVSAKRPLIVLEDVVKTGTYQQPENSAVKRKRSVLSSDESPLKLQENSTLSNVLKETDAAKISVQPVSAVDQDVSIPQIMDYPGICDSDTTEPTDIEALENCDNLSDEANLSISTTSHNLRNKKKISTTCPGAESLSDLKSKPIATLQSRSRSRSSDDNNIPIEQNALKQNGKMEVQSLMTSSDEEGCADLKKKVTTKGKSVTDVVSGRPSLTSDSVMEEKAVEIPCLVPKPKKKRRLRSRSTSKTTGLEDPKPIVEKPGTLDSNTKACEPDVPQTTRVKKVKYSIDQSAALESKLESLQKQSPLRPKHSLPINSNNSEVGGLAVVNTSPSIFPSQPTFIYRPAVSPASTPSPQTRETALPTTGGATTNFRKLPHAKTRQKSKLLGPGSMFESYTPKRFRLVGYEKKNLKTWQAGASNQTPYKTNRSNLRGNRPASCESSDKSSEVSDLTDVLPDNERLSTEGSAATVSTRTSRDSSFIKLNVSQRTSPFTDVQSLSPSSSVPFDEYANLQDSASATSYSSLGTEATGPNAFDDFLSGLMNGDDLSSLARTSGSSSTTIPDEPEGGLDFFSMLDM